MLYKFEVENFLSIRERQVIDLTIDAKGVDEADKYRYAPVFPGAHILAPKVVALFGANASGKTNVLRALEFLVNFICSSVQNNDQGILGGSIFKDEESQSRPTCLAMEFGGWVNLTRKLLEAMKKEYEHLRHENPSEYYSWLEGKLTGNLERCIYRYELELTFSAEGFFQVSRERLCQKLRGKGQWQRVFARDKEGKVKGSSFFTLKGHRHLLNTLAPNHSVIASFAKFSHTQAGILAAFWRWPQFSSYTGYPPNPGSDEAAINLLRNQRDEDALKLSQELGRIDVGIQEMKPRDECFNGDPSFIHRGLGSPMSWFSESHGTRAFIKLFLLLEPVLENGGIAVIDEMDAAVHQTVLEDLVGRFYARQGRSWRASPQLWFSCHSPGLLDDLSREEIVICEKDQRGATSAYSLMDVKDCVNKDHRRKYLSGIYGGLPRIG